MEHPVADVFRLAEEVNKLVPELVSKLNEDMAGVGGTPATKSWPDYGKKYTFHKIFCDILYSQERSCWWTAERRRPG